MIVIAAVQILTISGYCYWMSVGYAVAGAPRPREATAFAVLAGISFSHLLNDTIQSLVPAIYPMLKDSFALSFAQVGLMTLTLQVTASLLQPAVGLYTDRRPTPYSLVTSFQKVDCPIEAASVSSLRDMSRCGFSLSMWRTRRSR